MQMTDQRGGWLERSFERAEKSIASRPEHLRPRSYREETAQSRGKASHQRASRADKKR